MTDNTGTFVKSPAVWYLGFSADTPDALARLTFKNRFNVEPDTLFVEKGVKYVGPVPKRDTPDD